MININDLNVDFPRNSQNRTQELPIIEIQLGTIIKKKEEEED